MDERALTAEQHKAVYMRNRDILVSAAAGSGKTSVLSKRIVELIREGEDIRRMLICTYTKLAAGEMRDRISRELYNASEESHNERLSRQAEYAQMADICTIHKFAHKVVKENHLYLGLPEGMRIVEGNEFELLLGQTMEDVFSSYYENRDEDFLILRKRYGSRNDKKLREKIRKIFDLARSRPEGLIWLTNLSEREMPSEYEKLLKEKTDMHLGEIDSDITKLSQALQLYGQTTGDPGMLKKYSKLDAQIQRISEWLEKLTDTFEVGGDISLCLAGFEKERMVQGLQPEELKAEVKRHRENIVKNIDALKELYDSWHSGRLNEEYEYLHKQTKLFSKVITDINNSFREVKRERKLIDYDDILAYAYEALKNEEIARTYQQRYDFLFVDEYQDTNPIQEAILTCIGQEGRRFMVGDIKQSIYRFRLADPTIFLSKSRIMEKREMDEVIHMNDNFRSSPVVIETVNGIMEQLMSKNLGEIDYNIKERLKAGKNFAGKTEFILGSAEGEEENDDEENPDNVSAEAQMIARRICGMVGTPLTEDDPDRRIGYSDICVLLRSANVCSEIFAKVFAKYGIPAETASASFSSVTEIDLFVHLLRLLDDRRDDLALLAVLRSHIGGFDEEDLAEIRCGSSEEYFSDAFEEIAQEDSVLGKNCRTFLERMDTLRHMENAMTLEDFIVHLKNDTDYTAHIEILPNGAERASNFRMFFAQVMRTASEQESLSALVAGLEEIKRAKGNYFAVDRNIGKNCVQILTVHASKGLEFPVVFYAGLAKKFNTKDLNEMVIHPALGIADDIRDEETHKKSHSVIREIVRYQLEKEMKSEELRILYVGMTRAQNRLILSAVCKDPEKQIGDIRNQADGRNLYRMSSPMEWLLTALTKFGNMGDWFGKETTAGPTILHTLEKPGTEPKEERPERPDRKLEDIIAETEGFPHQPFLHYESNHLPAKIGVTALVQRDSIDWSSRALISESGSDGQLSATERGTLIHLMMEHLDFEKSGREGIQEQLEMLRRRLIINEEEAKILWSYSEYFSAFLNTDMAKRIRASRKVLREIPFSLLEDAKSLGMNENGNIIVNGIIDLVFEEDDGLVIVDYKSNYVDDNNLELLERHYAPQLNIYASALEEILHRPVKEKYLYFLRTNTFSLLR